MKELNGKAIKKIDFKTEWTLRHQNKAKDILKNSIGNSVAAEMIYAMNVENEILALIYPYVHETKYNEPAWEERKEAFLDEVITDDMKAGIQDFFALVMESIITGFQTYFAKMQDPKGLIKSTS